MFCSFLYGGAPKMSSVTAYDRTAGHALDNQSARLQLANDRPRDDTGRGPPMAHKGPGTGSRELIVDLVSWRRRTVVTDDLPGSDRAA